MKTVIQLDDDGYYVGNTIADSSPLEDGVYLFPRNSIDVPPPVIPDTAKAKWTGDDWKYILPTPEVITPTPPPTQAELNADVLGKIDEQERKCIRSIRELLLNPSNVTARQYLQNAESEIAALRGQLL
jgi:hypothetical protein